MSDQVWITKNGFEPREWDPEVRQMVPVEKQRSMLHYLRCSCHIEDGVTLGDVFNAVEPHADLVNLIENWAWCDVRAFHAEAKKSAKPSTMHCIEIAKSIQMELYTDPDINSAQENLDVSGVGPLDYDEEWEGGRKKGEIVHWAIDFTPVSEMVNLPVRLAPRVNVRRTDYNKHGMDAFEDLGNYPACYSLLDVLGAIYFEISFHGSPDSRDEKLGELVDMKAQIDAGTATLVPLDLGEGTVQ